MPASEKATQRVDHDLDPGTGAGPGAGAGAATYHTSGRSAHTKASARTKAGSDLFHVSKKTKLPALAWSQVARFLPASERHKVSTIFRDAKGHHQCTLSETFQETFPKQWLPLFKKHTREKDQKWMAKEMRALYQKNYGTKSCSKDEKRKRQLCWYVRAGELKKFFELKPTLKELTNTKDPLDNINLIDLLRKMQKSWLADVYKKFKAKGFAQDTNPSHIASHREAPVNTSALHWATYCNQFKTIEALLSAHPADINKTTSTGATPLFIAAKSGQIEMVKYLLPKGADANAVLTHNGLTPLLAAARKDHVDVVNALLEHGADINLSGGDMRFSPLHEATVNGHPDVVKALLNHGADVNVAMPNSRVTPLFMASTSGRLDVVNVLLEHGADIHAATAIGTPLASASLQGHPHVAQVLIEHGAKVDTLDTYTKIKLLISAAQQGCSDVVQHLLGNGTDVNAAGTDGTTPLYAAAKNGHLDLVKYLLANGATVDARPIDEPSCAKIARRRGVDDPCYKAIIEHIEDKTKLQHRRWLMMS